MKIYKDPSSDPKPLRGAAAIEHIKATTDLGPESADVCEPFRSAIAWTPEGSECYVDEMRYWVPVSWANNTFGGRVTLVGDAAHPMLPCEFLLAPATIE